MPMKDYYAKLGGAGEKHKPYTHQNQFLGDTKGNRDLPPNRYEASGGKGESHKAYTHQHEFLGDTKGNRDLKTDRSTGLPGGKGSGRHKAGGVG